MSACSYFCTRTRPRCAPLARTQGSHPPAPPAAPAAADAGAPARAVYAILLRVLLPHVVFVYVTYVRWTAERPLRLHVPDARPKVVFCPVYWESAKDITQNNCWRFPFLISPPSSCPTSGASCARRAAPRAPARRARPPGRRRAPAWRPPAGRTTAGCTSAGIGLINSFQSGMFYLGAGWNEVPIPSLADITMTGPSFFTHCHSAAPRAIALRGGARLAVLAFAPFMDIVPLSFLFFNRILCAFVFSLDEIKNVFAPLYAKAKGNLIAIFLLRWWTYPSSSSRPSPASTSRTAAASSASTGGTRSRTTRSSCSSGTRSSTSPSSASTSTSSRS